MKMMFYKHARLFARAHTHQYTCISDMSNKYNVQSKQRNTGKKLAEWIASS